MSPLALFRSAVAVVSGIPVDFKLISSATLMSHGDEKPFAAPALWKDGPALLYVARRLG